MPIRDRFRQALKLLLDEGWTPKKIATKVGCSIMTVYRADPKRFRTGRR